MSFHWQPETCTMHLFMQDQSIEGQKNDVYLLLKSVYNYDSFNFSQ